jgi:hypothetical protein
MSRTALVWLLCLFLAGFYVAGARRHARTVNVSKARGDQTGYLVDAEVVYANWHGRQPAGLVGVRNRMPLYAAFLSLFYRQDMSDPRFFEVGRDANIYLSLALLAIVWLVARRYLPPHPAANLTGVAAFGWFIFKAGYTQSELLFYTLFFLAFVACLELFESRTEWRLPLRGATAGALCALAHLTKAATLPFVGIVLAAGTGWTFAPLMAPGKSAHAARRSTLRRLASLAALALAFIVVLWPYISNSKRVFGRYFYNVNSTFYVWYDNWPLASVGTLLHGDGQHWPTMPESELPGPARYWREHSVGQIVDRLEGGFHDMGVVVRRDFDLIPYLALYLGMFGWLCITRRRSIRDIIREHPWSVLFVPLYGATYLLATAFYYPISGTGTGRFLLAHALPLFFVLSRIFASRRLSDTRWRAGSVAFGLGDFNQLVSAVILFNVAFRVWPRLMTTYGGF